jgi:hypothetical protein
MANDARHPAAPGRGGFDRRVSVAISVARLVLMAGIVTGHAMLLPDFLGLYAPGVPYPAGADGFAAFRAALAGQGGLFDRMAFAGGLTFWSLNFAFYALSGFSLWYATRRRGVFNLRDYFFGRFFGIYLGFAAAAVLYILGALLLGGVAYQLAFDRFLSGPLRRTFERPIAL